MNIIIGCEESQAVCVEFRKLGHNAFSCDLQKCSGGHPEWHFKMDIFKAINAGVLITESGESVFIDKWDAMIGHPDCTYLTVSANKWIKDQPKRKSGALVGEARREARREAIEFFMKMWNCGIEKIALENPIGCMSSVFRKPNQVKQPWMFGHGETKATCLWIKGFPNLKSTDIVSERVQKLHLLPPSKDRAKLRSKTYVGIARAMAEQWGGKIIENKSKT